MKAKCLDLPASPATKKRTTIKVTVLNTTVSRLRCPHNHLFQFNPGRPYNVQERTAVAKPYPLINHKRYSAAIRIWNPQNHVGLVFGTSKPLGQSSGSVLVGGGVNTRPRVWGLYPRHDLFGTGGLRSKRPGVVPEGSGLIGIYGNIINIYGIHGVLGSPRSLSQLHHAVSAKTPFQWHPHLMSTNASFDVVCQGLVPWV